MDESGWAAEVEAAGPGRVTERMVEVFVQELLPHGGTCSTHDGGYCVTFDVGVAWDADGAATEALRIFRDAVGRTGLPPWPVVRVEVRAPAARGRRRGPQG